VRLPRRRSSNRGGERPIGIAQGRRDRPSASPRVFGAVAVLAASALQFFFFPPNGFGAGLIGSLESEVQVLCARLRSSVVCVEASGASRGVTVGSGVVIDSAGIVVTTASVVRGASRVIVRVSERGEIAGRLLGLDPVTNLAVIQVEGATLTPAPLASSADSRLGSWVMILGNSYGAGPTVSVGILSGRRLSTSIDDPMGLLQVNAPVNPGDSGAPLVNSRGEVIGIVCAALTPSENPAAGPLVAGRRDAKSWGSGATVGFAIPIAAGLEVVREIRSKGRVVRGFLGIQIRQLTPEEIASAPLAARRPLLVTGVMPDRPAARAGFQVGDLILEANGEAVASPRHLQRIVARMAPQASLRLSFTRGDSLREVAAILDEMPATLPGAELIRAPAARAEGAPRDPVISGDAAREARARLARLEKELGALRSLIGTPGHRDER